jgi:toxin ParE1/3/4
MPKFRLSVRAGADLLAIFECTEAKFGAYQAEAYYSGLERTFGLLADFPQIGASAEEVFSGLRRFRFQSHYIFYSEELDHVFIRALVHIAQNIRPELFD